MKNIFTKTELILKRIRTNLSLVVMAFLIGYIVFLQECQRTTPCPEVTETVDTIYLTDTVHLKGDVVYYPKPHEVIKTDTQYINLSKEDSARIVQDYTKIRKYNLPIMDDTNGKVNVFADVQFNAIKSWTYSATVYPRTTVIEKNHVYISEPKNKFFLGLQTGMNIPDKTMILSPTIAILSKNEHLYQLGYDPFNKSLYGGLAWKLKW